MQLRMLVDNLWERKKCQTKKKSSPTWVRVKINNDKLATKKHDELFFQPHLGERPREAGCSCAATSKGSCRYQRDLIETSEASERSKGN